MTASRAEVCVAACADLFAGDGEVLASPMGTVPTLGARLAALTGEPLVLSDGEAYLLAGAPPLGTVHGIEGWLPYRQVFDIVALGRRHVVMGASQLDSHGNQNIAGIGAFDAPRRQLLGVRGAPGNTVNHRTSYWVPRHGPRVFVPCVDQVSGVGRARAEAAGPSAARYHDVYRVVTDLAVFDFCGPDHTLRLLSVHPGVRTDDVAAATGCDYTAGDVAGTRAPTTEELRLIRDVLDPDGRRDMELTPR